MRLGVSLAQLTLRIDRGDRVIRPHRFFASVDHSDLEIHDTGQQQAVRTDGLPHACAGEGGIARRRHLGVVPLRIAIAQVVGDAAFRPQYQAPALRPFGAAQPGNALELFFELGSIVDLVLSQIGLHQRQRQTPVAALPSREIDHSNHETDKPYAYEPFRLREPDKCDGERDRYPRQGITAGIRQEDGKARSIPRAQHHHGERPPAVTAENPATQPFGCDPHGAEG